MNVGAIVLTICALSVAGLRIHDEVGSRRAASKVGKPRTIANWQEYGTAGTRIGPKNAPVVMVEFLDFQCPFCRVASGSIHDLQRWYGKDLAVVYRHLPIPVHRFAYPAALAAECAGRANKFVAMHDLLFAQPDSIGPKPWTRFALEAGVSDTVAFVRCMADDSAAAAVRLDSIAAVSLGVTATPTFIINSVVISGNAGFAQLNEHIKSALKERRADVAAR